MLIRDLRFGLRLFSRNLGFTILAILMSALGIALTASMFTVVYAVLLRPLPFANAEQIALIGQANNQDTRPGPASLPNINDWRAQSRSFQGLAYWELSTHSVESNGNAKSVVAIQSSANLFSLLQVQPMLGRTFLPDEDQPGRNNVAVLSTAVWKSAFLSDPKVINSNVKVGGEQYTVIGIMPESFVFPLTEDGPTIWVPIQPNKHQEDRNTAMLQVVGRLKDGVPVETAQAELTNIFAQTNAQNGGRVLVKDYREVVTGNVRPVLLALEAAVLAIWLIASVNVVGLLLARATRRRKEIAIRLAIGSNRWQLLSQFFAESALLSGVAGILGLWLAFGATYLLRAYLGASLPFAHTIGINLPVIGIVLLLSVISTLVFGMWPALQAFWSEPQDALSDASTRTGTSKRQRRVRDLLVVTEVALSLVLLLHAGLLLRSVYNMRNVPLGFVPENLIVAQLPLFQENNPGRDVIQTVYKPLLEELQHTPGVQSAGISSILPMNPDSNAQIPVEVFGRSESGDQPSMAQLRLVSPDIYRALGIRVLKGRSFADTDSRTSPWVVVVNQRFAHKYFQNEDPIGQQIRTAGDGPHKYSTIVGVVEDTHQKSLDEPVEPEVNLCFAQLKPDDDFAGMLSFFAEVAVRADQQPATVIPAVRKLLQQINPEGAYTISTMQETVDKSMSTQTLVAQMVWLFAGSAVVIALIGLYGLLSYNVSVSTRDIAIRLALGATRSNVLGMVLKHALLVVVAGLVIGFFIWQQTANLLRNYLYGIGTHDLPTIFAVAGVLLACGLLAGFVPARRASLVDPIRSLRHE